MAVPIEFRPPRGAAEWNDAVAGRRTSTPFHAWEFLEPAARDWGLAFEPLLAICGSDVVGAVPLLVDHRGGLRWVNHLPLVNYLGPAVDAEHLPATLAALAARGRWRTVRERQEVRLDPADAPEVRGWTRRIGTSMVVPLEGRTVDELGRQASRGFRQAPGRSERFGLTLAPSTLQDLRDALPHLEHEVFGRHDVQPPYGDATYAQVWQAFDELGLAHAVTASVDGVAVGVTVVLVRGDVAYEWVSAADGSNARPSMAVRRHLILWAHAAGHRSYDMLGGSTPGITAFKQSLGAVEQPYVIYERGIRH